MAHTDRASAKQEQMIKIILVVDDDAGVGQILVEALNMEAPYRTLLATNGLEALAMVKTVVPDLFVSAHERARTLGSSPCHRSAQRYSRSSHERECSEARIGKAPDVLYQKAI